MGEVLGSIPNSSISFLLGFWRSRDLTYSFKFMMSSATSTTFRSHYSFSMSSQLERCCLLSYYGDLPSRTLVRRSPALLFFLLEVGTNMNHQELLIAPSDASSISRNIRLTQYQKWLVSKMTWSWEVCKRRLSKKHSIRRLIDVIPVFFTAESSNDADQTSCRAKCKICCAYRCLSSQQATVTDPSE